MPSTSTPCSTTLPPHDERPHFAGSARQVGTLVTAASKADLHIADIRSAGPAEQRAKLDGFYEEARMRARSGGTLPARALVLDGDQVNEDYVYRRVRDIVDVRRLGLHVWIESRDALPGRIAAQLERDYCAECVTSRITDAMTAGRVL